MQLGLHSELQSTTGFIELICLIYYNFIPSEYGNRTQTHYV